MTCVGTLDFDLLDLDLQELLTVTLLEGEPLTTCLLSDGDLVALDLADDRRRHFRTRHERLAYLGAVRQVAYHQHTVKHYLLRLFVEILTLLHAIPSRWVDYRILQLRHEDLALKRSTSDLNDVAALSVAFPYCDVVVTEKSWTHFAQRADFETEFGTRVLSNLNKLIPILLAAS